MSLPEFTPWPKIARTDKLHVVATEKIDGTNAAVGVLPDGTVYAQSRKRIITPDADNFGFARWVAEHAELLALTLGEGVHFGEWWGSGIQRGYGLAEKRFSLFNTRRWYWLADLDVDVDADTADRGKALRKIGVNVVPTLGVRGELSSAWVDEITTHLHEHGSYAAPCAPCDPEGVVFHVTQGSTYFNLKRIIGPAANAPKSTVAA